jgi:hypothetical protein
MVYAGSGGGAPAPGVRCKLLRLRRKYINPSTIIMATTAPTTIPPMAPPDKEGAEFEPSGASAITVTVVCPFDVESGVETVVPLVVVV